MPALIRADRALVFAYQNNRWAKEELLNLAQMAASDSKLDAAKLLFEQAKKLGGILVVTVTPDRYVNKGPHRPIFPAELRAEAIAALECVDFVAVNEWPMAVETIQLLRKSKFDVPLQFNNFRD